MEAKRHKPCAIVLISQLTGGLAVVPTSTGPWSKCKRYDRDRNISDWFFEVPRSKLATFDDFVEWLHAHDAPVTN